MTFPFQNIFGYQLQLLQVFWSCWQVLPFREWNKMKHIIVLYYSFEHKKFFPFQNLSLGFISSIIYRQHNSPDRFLEYLNETMEKFSGENVCLMGDFNLMCLLKPQNSRYNHEFLTTLQNSYLIPTIDEPTRVHSTSTSFIDNSGAPQLRYMLQLIFYLS